ncbi:Acetyltransferase [Bacillus sp. ZZV12-4809]|nr:Acetyltransferase [Bacillus sp. ZZV12-4809]
MQIIPFSKENANGILLLWNRELGKDFPMRGELLRQNSFEDKSVLHSASSVALDENGNVIGFIVAKAWLENMNVMMNKETGWIHVLLVDSDFRGQGIGTALLKNAEGVFKGQNIRTIKLGSDPWHYFPGIPDQYIDAIQWFEKHGYHHDGNEYDLICRYDHQRFDPPKKDNVDFSLLKPGEKDELLSFLNRCFPGRWEYEALHYFKKGGMGREFVVLKKDNRIIGFCRINDDQSPLIAQNVYWSPLFKERLGGVGPLGVDPAERNKGYGLAVVEAGITFLRERNIDTIVIDWTGLVDFYGKLGYKVWKSYSKFSKEI